MKENKFLRFFSFLLVVTIATVGFHANARVSSDWANVHPRIEKDGIRYIIFFDPNDKIYSAVVCSFDDKEETKKAYSGRVVVPDSITYEDVTYTVRGLFDHAFDGCSDLDELVLPNTLTWLWSYSIANCGDIDIRFPDGIITENCGAVFLNTRVKGPFELPEIFRIVGAYFFSAFPWIEEYTFPITCNIGGCAFCESNISKIDFKNDSSFLDGDYYKSRLGLDSYAFLEANLEEITLPLGNLFIRNYAFSEQPALKRLTFPNTPYIYVAGIDMGSSECPNNYFLLIENCPNLEEIICETETPPAIIGGFPYKPQDHAIIMDDYSHTVLKVPTGSESAYAEHPVWGQFVNISDIAGNVYRTASVDDSRHIPKSDTKRIVVDGRSSTASVRIDAPSTVSIVNLNGVEVCRKKAEPGVFTAALQPGVYIVTIIVD